MKRIIVLLLLICPLTLNGKSSYCKIYSIIKTYMDTTFSDARIKYELRPFDARNFYDEEFPEVKKSVFLSDDLPKCRTLKRNDINKRWTRKDYIALWKSKCIIIRFSDLYVLSDDSVLICACPRLGSLSVYLYFFLINDGQKWRIQRVKEVDQSCW